MIILKICGGLGNQMFQYAMGKSLSIDKNCDLKLDITTYDKLKNRPFELSIFDIENQIANETTLAKFSYKKNLFTRIQKKIDKLKSPYKRVVIKEQNFNFDRNILDLDVEKGIYLEGYWQSEKYFFHNSETIRKIFTFKPELSIENKKNIELICNTNSISLHVRRGDYLNNKRLFTCSLDYYQKAIEYISKKVSNPTFFLFSDDPDWVKHNLKISYDHHFIINNNNNNDFEDMRLMSLCKHNIIANSSFSWWGAWLNNNHDKIVIAPKNWFKDNNINTDDLIPENWIKL